jgi:hypothetical protein
MKFCQVVPEICRGNVHVAKKERRIIIIIIIIIIIKINLKLSLKSNNVEFYLYCDGHFENGDR